MSAFAFATCNPHRALEIIREFYDVTADEVGDLLNLIRQDKARVMDPMMHSPCQIILGTNGTPEDVEVIRKACEPLARLREAKR